MAVHQHPCYHCIRISLYVDLGTSVFVCGLQGLFGNPYVKRGISESIHLDVHHWINADVVAEKKMRYLDLCSQYKIVFGGARFKATLQWPNKFSPTTMNKWTNEFVHINALITANNRSLYTTIQNSKNNQGDVGGRNISWFEQVYTSSYRMTFSECAQHDLL